MYQKLKLIAIDLSKQNMLKDPQQINFIGKLLRNTNNAFHHRKIKRNNF